MPRQSLLPPRQSILIALALAGAATHFMLNTQFARLSLTYGVHSRAEVMRVQVEDAPCAILHGVGTAPWQYRYVPYALVGKLIERGASPILVNSTFKAVTLFAWLIALQGYVKVWSPSISGQAFATAAGTLLGIVAIPWYLYNLEDFAFLAGMTAALTAVFRKRFIRFIIAAAAACVFKEVAATLILAWVLVHQSWRSL